MCFTAEGFADSDSLSCANAQRIANLTTPIRARCGGDYGKHTPRCAASDFEIRDISNHASPRAQDP
jgi:hypothetical protein